MKLDGGTRDSEFLDALGAARLGNAEGFTALYAAYNRQVHLLGLLFAHQNPEQLVSEVFANVFHGIKDFVGARANFAAIVFDVAMVELSNAEQVVDQVTGDAKLDAIRLQLQQLNGTQKQFLLLRVVFGLNNPQAARALNLPLGEIRSLLSSAADTLRAKPMAEVQP